MTLADLKIGQDAVLRTIGGQGELRTTCWTWA